MRYRTFGRTGWQVSDVGYGMWGMAGWTGSDDEESHASLDQAIALGCNFFDTAWAYGDGRSERILGETLRRHAAARLYVATKIPPKNRQWPARNGPTLEDVFPADYIREYTEKSLANIGVPSLDLQQFHVWDDEWAGDDRWQRAVRELKDEGLVKAFGISVNRFEPANVLRALDTGLIDSVQVVYNVLDQNPEDELFPACQEQNIAVIARVPFDEGSLTGTLTRDSRWPERRLPQPLLHPREPRRDAAAHRRAQEARPGRHDPAGAGAASYPPASGGHDGHPGHAQAQARRAEHRRQRCAALPPALMAELKRHRWNRTVDWE